MPLFLRALFISMLTLGCLGGRTGYAEPSVEAVPSEIEGKLIEKVTIKGLEKTHEKVVLREMLLKEGDIFNYERLQDSVQRLKNTRIFRAVTSHFHKLDNGNVEIEIEIDEKWTTIPVTRGGSGGGTTFFVIGVYDVNSFGLFQELGSQYENYNGHHSLTGWYRNPRFRNERERIGLELGYLARDLPQYNSERVIVENTLLKRGRANIYWDREITPWFTLGSGFEWNHDQHSPIKVDVATRYDLDRTVQGGRALTARINSRLGLINYEDYLLDGVMLETVGEVSSSLWGSQFDFYRVYSTLTYYERLPLLTNLAFRFSLGQTNASPLQHVFSIGGLEHARGFLDGEYRNSAFWLSNAEARIPSYNSSLFVLHHVFFFDMLNTGKTLGDTSKGEFAKSLGTGVRFIVPKIYRLVVRCDYAWVLTPKRYQGFSIGMQQFF